MLGSEGPSLCGMGRARSDIHALRVLEMSIQQTLLGLPRRVKVESLSGNMKTKRPHTVLVVDALEDGVGVSVGPESRLVGNPPDMNVTSRPNVEAIPVLNQVDPRRAEAHSAHRKDRERKIMALRCSTHLNQTTDP